MTALPSHAAKSATIHFDCPIDPQTRCRMDCETEASSELFCDTFWSSFKWHPCMNKLWKVTGHMLSRKFASGLLLEITRTSTSRKKKRASTNIVVIRSISFWTYPTYHVNWIYGAEQRKCPFKKEPSTKKMQCCFQSIQWNQWNSPVLFWGALEISSSTKKNTSWQNLPNWAISSHTVRRSLLEISKSALLRVFRQIPSMLKEVGNSQATSAKLLLSSPFFHISYPWPTLDFNASLSSRIHPENNGDDQ